MTSLDQIRQDLASLDKKQASIEKLAVSHARLNADHRHLSIATKSLILAALSILIGAGGIAYGVHRSSQNTIEFQTKALELELTLEFLRLKEKDREAYLLNLKNFSWISDQTVSELEIAHAQDRALKRADDVVSSASETQTPSPLVEIARRYSDLTSGKTKKRNAAQTEIAQYLERCATSECLEFVDDMLNADSLITAENYMRAVGTLVALSIWLKSDGAAQAKLTQYAGADGLVAKIHKLNDVDDGELRQWAADVLANLPPRSG